MTEFHHFKPIKTNQTLIIFVLNILYFGGGFMVLKYIYGIVMIHLLPVNHFLSIDLKMTLST